MEFRVLGPLEVVRDGEPVDLGGAKQRTVLATLLVERGRVVGADRLAELVWDGAPPEAAATTLRSYISNLRRALRPDDVLLTKTQGYALDVPRESIDACVFEALSATGREAVASGDHDQAAALLAQAVGMWRGRAFEGCDSAGFAQAEAGRLEELKLNCIEDLVEARLALGQHTELTAELEVLTAAHPWRERLWIARLLALYRSGRQGDALNAYEEARRKLADELGIEPSPELREVHASIVRQEQPVGRAASSASKQVVTFLFTDVELSTERLLRAKDEYEYASVLERHHGALREAFAAHGGRRIRTWGDAFFAAFDSATEAVRAALDSQLTLRTQCPDDEVRVRMGIHTGEIAFIGDDYVGIAIHAAARVQAAAHGGQVLITESTKQLLESEIAPGVSFLDLGPHNLKDIPESLRLYQVTHPDLPNAFPPPRTMSALPHNLPAQLTSFVGRTDDVRRIADTLERARVVTLTGVGGVGKTRLAIEVGAEVLPRYPDGVWLCELAPLGDPDAVVHAIARVLRLNQQENLTYRESVIASLRRQRALLILDNCEHLLEPVADLLEEVVQSCPTITVLATSREGLGVEGEHMLPVRSLALPAEDAACETLEDTEAVKLFCDRARAVRPDFELAPRNAGAVTEICRRLDGIPLAIELAAARLTSMGPLEIAARLDRRFRFLRSGRRTAVERHRTLQATVDWSYALLDAGEQLLFERLSVFAGGFSLEAAEAICGAGLGGEVADLLQSLVAKSLVNADVSGEDTRYWMLETLRQYASDKLAERGEADAVRDAHVAWFLDFALRAEEGVVGPEDLAWFRAVDREIENLISAHEWAVTSDNVDALLRLIAALSWYGALRLTGRSSITDVWAVRALAVPGTDRHELAPLVYAAAAGAAWFVGDRSRSRELADRSLALAPDPDDPRRAHAMGHVAVLAMVEGRGEDAMAAINETVRLAGLGDNPLLQAQWLLNGAFFAGYFRGPTAALAYLEQARQLPVQSRFVRAYERYATGESILDADPAAAIAVLDEAVAMARELGSEFFRNVALLSASSLRGRHFDVYEALEGYPEIIESWHRGGNWRFQWQTLRNLLEHFARLGRDEAAVVLYFAAHEAPTADPESGAHGERLAKLIPQLEERMGAEAFSAARERGARMTGDEAVAFALDEISGALARREQTASVS